MAEPIKSSQVISDDHVDDHVDDEIRNCFMSEPPKSFNPNKAEDLQHISRWKRSLGRSHPIRLGTSSQSDESQKF